MVAFTRESLVAAAGLDPWALRDQFAAGDPEEIYALARAFRDAAAKQGDSVQLTTRGLEQAGDGYKVNNHTPIDVDAEVAATSRLLGNSGEKLGVIAKLLSDTASDLAAHTSRANTNIVSLEADVNAIITEWNGVVLQSGHDPEFRRDHASYMEPYLQRAVRQVRQYGDQIKASVGDYETALSGHLRTMADLGYVPSDALDEGPGDVDLSEAAARADAGKVNAALGRPPGKDGLLDIEYGSRTVALLNARVAAGYKLTPQELKYLDAWYEAVGADNLGRLPSYVREAAPSLADHRRGPDGQPLVSKDDVYRRVLTPIADGIMNLSNPAKGGHASTGEMPKAIQELVNQRVGYVDPHNGLRWPNKAFTLVGGQTGLWVQHAVGGGVDGLDRYTGFADLLGTADVTGGDGFTKDLAASAVRVKQDLNAAHAGARWALLQRAGNQPPDVLAKLDLITTDAAPSEMLQVVAHNHGASSDVLLDQHLRQEVLGLNWQDENGAAAVLHSGTERDPGQGGGTERQARAALAVIQEVGRDRDGYLARMGEQVQDSVKDVGIEYIDSFAHETAAESGYRTDLRDPLGRGGGPSFQLSIADRDHYLEFIAGTGDDDAVDFQAKATAFSEITLADAFQHGTPGQVQVALHRAGTLDGAITNANFDYAFDHAATEDQQAAAAARAESRHHLAQKVGIGLFSTLAGTPLAAASPALGPVVGVTTALVNATAVLNITDSPPPAAQLPRTHDALLSADHETYMRYRDHLALQAAVDGGVVDPSRLPDTITTRDASGHLALRPVEDLRDGNPRDDLVAAAAAIPQRPGGPAVDLNGYDAVRLSIADGTYDHLNPRDSPWSGADSGDLSYGDNDAVADGYPDDPRRLDDPHYNPANPDG